MLEGIKVAQCFFHPELCTSSSHCTSVHAASLFDSARQLLALLSEVGHHVNSGCSSVAS